MVATTRIGWIPELTKLVLILALFSIAGTAAAQSTCDAIYKFDGDLSDASGNGYDGTVFGRGDLPGSPQFAAGISGQAFLFDGKTGVYTDLDLHFDRCPQVTVTGWLRLNTPEPSGSNYIFSVGDWGPHGVSVAGRSLVLRGRGNGLQIKNAMRDERAWFFFAGVYDFDAGTFRLKFRNRTVEGKLPESLREPSGETFFGARDERLTSPAKDIYLDEVNIFGRALSDAEIGRVAAEVTSRPWLTAIAHSAVQSAGAQTAIRMPDSARGNRPPIGPTTLPGRGLDSGESGVQSGGSLDGAPSAAGLDVRDELPALPQIGESLDGAGLNATPTLEPGLAGGLVADFGLDGEWVRRDSNNDRNDGMRITVSNGQAVLTYVPPTATSNWHEGEILWQDIGSKGTLQVLGSNNAFYDAAIIVESADILHIDIDANGPGNDQSWERVKPEQLADRLDPRSPPGEQEDQGQMLDAGTAGESGRDPGLSAPDNSPDLPVVATAEDFANANSEPQTLDSMRESIAARDPLAAVRDEVAERTNRNRPPDLSDGSSREQQSDATSEVPDGPQPTGPRIIGDVLGSYGRDEHLFELTSGFIKSIGLGIYNSCAVKLNNEMSFICSRDSESLDLGVSLPSAFVSALRVCSGWNGELRGIEIGGDTERIDGSYWNQVDRNTINQPSRLTCGRDEAPQFGGLSLCAGDQLATGLIVHSNDLMQPVGLQLICRRAVSVTE